MDKKLEARIARLEKLLSSKSVKNESVKNRKLALEQRVTRLENAVKANRRSMKRKFESADNFEDELRGLLDRALEGHGCFVVSSDWDNNGAEIDIQNDMGDEEYYDDWECDYVTYRVEFDGRMYNVTSWGNFSEPNLGSFRSLQEVTRAILKDRGIE